MKRVPLMLAVFLFFASAYLVTFRGHYGSDQFLSYLTAESIVLDHSLAIGKRDFNISNIQGNMERAPTGIDGQRYTLFSLALPLAMTPLYFIGHLAAGIFPVNFHDYVTMFFVSMTNVFITALICSLLFYYLSLLGHSSRTALIVALLYGFGTMAWNYSQYSFAEPILTLFFLCSLLMLEKWETTDRFPQCMALGLGFALGLCLLTEVYAAVIIVPAILIYFFIRLWRRRPGWRAACSTMTCVALPLLAGIAVLFWFYWLRFGGLAAPRLAGRLSLALMPTSFYGLLFSPGKSFFLFVPPALLSLCGVKYFFQRNRDMAVVLVFIVIISVLFISSYVDWHGGWTWGPRYLFHLMLIAMLPLAEVFENKLFAAGWKRQAVRILILVSILIQLGGILINTGVYTRFAEHLQPGGDRYFAPYLSAVSGHWLLVIATVYHWFSGKALTLPYPAGSSPGWHRIDTSGFDGLDLWFINLPQYWHHPAAFWVSLFGTLILLIAAGLFFRYIWRTTAT